MMTCEVIRDLIPLYVDDCCSKDSEAAVAEHVKNCAECRRIFEHMNRRHGTTEVVRQPTTAFRRISSWKASLLQSIMLFVSFAVITIGVLLEGNTPDGAMNGLWAMALIIPATGYLLSLAHWFFVRSYQSKSAFSNGSCLATVSFTLIGYGWAFCHYTNGLTWTSPLIWIGVALAAVFCVLSKILSAQYAALLGKE